MTIQTLPTQKFEAYHRRPVLARPGASEVDLWGAQHGYLNGTAGWRGHALVEGDRVSRLYAIRGGLVAYVGGGYRTKTVYAIVEEFLSARERRVDLDALRTRLAAS